MVDESGGRVVPVFSGNVHEVRAYNRAAGLARGRLMVFLQVRGIDVIMQLMVVRRAEGVPHYWV